MLNLRKLPYLLAAERTPIVDELLDIVKERDDYIEELEREIRRLKKLPAKPAIKPSTLREKISPPADSKRPGSEKQKKTQTLPIHEVHVVKLPEHQKPVGCTFRGFANFTVQDISIQVVNHLFKCERYQTKDGRVIKALMPEAYRDQHFGPNLRAYILHQYFHQGVTQPLLWQQLKSWGISISKGQINNLIVHNKDVYHNEKEEVFQTGLFLSAYLQVDDTGARHQGHNGFCTYIGNEYFAYFNSNRYKNRLNFIQCLQGKTKEYILDIKAFNYLKLKPLVSDKSRSLLSYWQSTSLRFQCKEKLMSHLQKIGIHDAKLLEWCAEAAAFSHLRQVGLSKDILFLSDEAGQFKLPNMKHALCWVHVERKLRQLIPHYDEQAALLLQKQNQYWQLYQGLAAYKQKPNPESKQKLINQFEIMCQPVDNYPPLNKALARIKKWQHRLLLVLDYPFIPLHNNTGEQDIREYVRRRKISGGTRGELGRMARDTFASLKKTCYKLGVNFWLYLLEKTVNVSNKRLTDFMYQRASKDNEQLSFALSSV